MCVCFLCTSVCEGVFWGACVKQVKERVVDCEAWKIPLADCRQRKFQRALFRYAQLGYAKLLYQITFRLCSALSPISLPLPVSLCVCASVMT